MDDSSDAHVYTYGGNTRLHSSGETDDESTSVSSTEVAGFYEKTSALREMIKNHTSATDDDEDEEEEEEVVEAVEAEGAIAADAAADTVRANALPETLTAPADKDVEAAREREKAVHEADAKRKAEAEAVAAAAEGATTEAETETRLEVMGTAATTTTNAAAAAEPMEETAPLETLVISPRVATDADEAMLQTEAAAEEEEQLRMAASTEKPSPIKAVTRTFHSDAFNRYDQEAAGGRGNDDDNDDESAHVVASLYTRVADVDEILSAAPAAAYATPYDTDVASPTESPSYKTNNDAASSWLFDAAASERDIVAMVHEVVAGDEARSHLLATAAMHMALEVMAAVPSSAKYVKKYMERVLSKESMAAPPVLGDATAKPSSVVSLRKAMHDAHGNDVRVPRFDVMLRLANGDITAREAAKLSASVMRAVVHAQPRIALIALSTAERIVQLDEAWYAKKAATPTE